MIKIEYNIDDINAVAKQLLVAARGAKVLTFEGDLGAGKTTLVRAIVEAMGAQNLVTSPTFTYLNVYNLPGGQTAYHFDLYRLKNASEFEMAGFFEYLYQPNSIALIEWPEVISGLLVKDVCRVRLKVLGSVDRLLSYELILSGVADVVL